MTGRHFWDSTKSECLKKPLAIPAELKQPVNASVLA